MVNNTALNAHSGSNLSFMAYHNQSAVVNECPAAAHNHKPIVPKTVTLLVVVLL